MSYTNRARIGLALTPVLLPVVLVCDVLLAIPPAFGHFLFHANLGGELRSWYRDVWRVAIYGSVDDPE